MVKLYWSVDMIHTRETFLAEFNNEDCRIAAARLLDVAQMAGATFNWGRKGVSIRVKCSRWRNPISVAWFYPPFERGYIGKARDFFFGIDTGRERAYRKGGRDLQAVLRRWGGRFRDISEGTPLNSGGIRGHIFNCHAAVRKIDILAERLSDVIAEIKAL